MIVIKCDRCGSEPEPPVRTLTVHVVAQSHPAPGIVGCAEVHICDGCTAEVASDAELITRVKAAATLIVMQSAVPALARMS